MHRRIFACLLSLLVMLWLLHSLAFAAFTPDDLKTELTADTAGIGYGPYVASGQDNELAELINQVRQGAAYSIFQAPVPNWIVFTDINDAEFFALTTTQNDQLRTILSVPLIDFSKQNVRNMMS